MAPIFIILHRLDKCQVKLHISYYLYIRTPIECMVRTYKNDLDYEQLQPNFITKVDCDTYHPPKRDRHDGDIPPCGCHIGSLDYVRPLT